MNLQRNLSSKTWDWRAALSAGRLANESGDVRRAEVRFREALDLARAAHSREGLQEARNSLGVALAEQGRLEEAEPMFRMVMAETDRDQTQGRAFNASMSNLAQVLSRSGRIDEAEALLRQLLSVTEPDPLERAAVLNNLAVILEARERHEEAEQLLRESLGLAQSVLGWEHPRTIGLLANLGISLKNSGREDEGIAVLGQALGMSEVVLGSDHPQTKALHAELDVA